jgi:hypothetical protein
MPSIRLIRSARLVRQEPISAGIRSIGTINGRVDVSQPESPSGVSPATPQGRLIDGAGSLGSQPGWRGRVGRIVAYVALIGVALAVVAIVAGVVWLSV